MKRVVLVRPAAGRQGEFLAAVRRSRGLHGAWVSPPATPAAFRAYLRRAERPNHESFLVCRRRSLELVGAVDISEIVRGIFRSGYLSYYAFEPHERDGLMTEGLGAVVEEAFRRLSLHRLEANIQPENRASIRLVRRLGFRLEGFSPRYLKIRGRWRDHQRWAILADEPAAAGRRR